MNKYPIGAKLYYFKYANDLPELRELEVGAIKQTKDGYKYSIGHPGSAYINEEICFETPRGAIEYGEAQLRKHLDA